MPSAVPSEDFTLNYEPIKHSYAKAGSARADSFDFAAWTDPTPPGSVPTPTQAAGNDTFAKTPPDLSDEMPEDLPAGLVVYTDYDFVF